MLFSLILGCISFGTLLLIFEFIEKPTWSLSIAMGMLLLMNWYGWRSWLFEFKWIRRDLIDKN